jgi:hypothetical protein
MHLNRTRVCAVKDKNSCKLSLNQPRFITLLDDSKITVKCAEYGFVEVILFKKGDYKLVLTEQYGELYLEKKRIRKKII